MIRRLFYLCTLLLLIPSLAHGAVSVDADSSSTCTSCSSLSWAHTVNASATLLLCTVTHSLSGTPTGLTWNTVSNFSSVTTALDTGGGTLSMWQLATPTSGTHNTVITMSGAADAVAGGCTSFIAASTTLGTPVTSTDPIDPEPLLDGVALTVPSNGMAFAGGLYTYGTCTNEVPNTGSERYDVCADAGGNNAGAIALSLTTTGTASWSNHPSGAYEAVMGVPISPATVTTLPKRRPFVTQ